ncbi:MAG: gliding motility lipoprotein GldB [Flavobacteriaceae bacterium]|jgi:gliding motility-associated lipoprotein GldB|nr:gliding motility lipoprotein GldB [Flavobacteriaceae bacterium]
MKNIFKKRLIFSVFLLAGISCAEKSEIEKQIEGIPMLLEVERFDKIFYETPISEFYEIKRKHAVFFPVEYSDSLYLAKMQDSLNKEIYTEVQKKYADFSPVQDEIEDLFRRIKFYFPKYKLPSKITTLISEVDYENKNVLTDSVLVVSLDLYLGREHKFYEFPDYFRQTFQRSQILPDIVSSFSETVIPPLSDRTFLSQMIYFGKEMYLKDILIPNYSDADKIAYTNEQLQWCISNEKDIWLYFVEGRLLYDTDSRLIQRFVAPAPFSKFYLEIDNESPGRTGVYIGWQIVRSFMENNNVSLHDMLKLEAKTIFEQSRYKPKR